MLSHAHNLDGYSRVLVDTVANTPLANTEVNTMLFTCIQALVKRLGVKQVTS